jgi:hypothetical protein
MIKPAEDEGQQALLSHWWSNSHSEEMMAKVKMRAMVEYYSRMIQVEI